MLLPEPSPLEPLFERAKQGDEQATIELWLKTRERLQSWLEQLCRRWNFGPSLDADDLAFLLYDKWLGKFRDLSWEGEGPYLSYFKKVAQSIAKDESGKLKSEKRGGGKVFNAGSQLLGMGERPGIPGQATPSAIASDREREWHLTQFRSLLRDVDQQLLVWHGQYVPLKEMARRLGFHEKKISRRMREVLKQGQDYLRKKGLLSSGSGAQL